LGDVIISTSEVRQAKMVYWYLASKPMREAYVGSFTNKVYLLYPLNSDDIIFDLHVALLKVIRPTKILTMCEYSTLGQA